MARIQSSADAIADGLSNLISELDPRMIEDTKLLSTSPSLDMLYRIKLTWQNFSESLSASARELTHFATSLEGKLASLDQLNKTWQATLQSAKEPDTPPPVLQSLHSVIDSIEQARRAVESGRARVLTVRSRLSEAEARVRTVLSLVEQAQIQELKGLLVRDSPPIWSLETGLSRDWKKQSDKSFSSQLKASTAFTKRLPFTFLIHALLIVVIAIALQWMRGRIRKSAKEKPDLQRAVPILDLPVSTAFVLSILISPSIYPQAPRSIQAILTPLIATTKAALNASIAIGSLDISLGRILAFLMAIWASFLISGFLRFLLEEDIYRDLRLASGIPYAISTMLHYVILLVGFFIALGALGIDLTKITILAGAFSVGVGFGLQNVINNFVSGLILLFERPIKIGDVIEVSGNVGEVRRIGIRASVIRTADGSEVIVPNGSLISSQVTNWTFSDRQRAVEVSVSVVGSADVQRMAELLKTTAAAHPDVAKEPTPRVYVVNLTAGAVTFQLRAWTDRHEAWAQLRSDLSVAINDALAREKIAIV